MDQRPIGDVELPCRLSIMLCLLVIELESGVDIADLERHMVHANGTRLFVGSDSHMF